MECNVNGCERQAEKCGLCGMHYLRKWRTGRVGGPEPTKLPTGLTREELLEKIKEEIVVSDDGCHLLKHRIYSGNIYPQVNFEGEFVQIHRLVVEIKEGRKLARNEVVRHSCHNPGCIREEHLTPGTRLDNRLDNCRSGLKAGFEKLTPEEVREIRRRYDSGESVLSIGYDFLHVQWGTIRNAARRRTWTHVE